jgi:hypothetical protein
MVYGGPYLSSGVDVINERGSPLREPILRTHVTAAGPSTQHRLRPPHSTVYALHTAPSTPSTQHRLRPPHSTVYALHTAPSTPSSQHRLRPPHSTGATREGGHVTAARDDGGLCIARDVLAAPPFTSRWPMEIEARSFQTPLQLKCSGPATIINPIFLNAGLRTRNL